MAKGFRGPIDEQSMAKAEQDEAYEKLLVGVLQRTIDFLKFAETKNAALLTFASAWTLALLNMVSGTSHMSPTTASALAVALPLTIGAGGLALVSFFPRINLSWFLGGARAGPHPKNLLFFGDVASLTISDFRKAFHARYYPPTGRANKQEYLDDLTTQIAINSQITSRKMRLFRWGLGLISFAALVLMPSTFTWAWNKLFI